MRPVHASVLISTATAILLIASPASAATTIVNVTGDNPAAIQSDVDAFRDALGLNDTGNQPINSPGSRRQINWDGAAVDALEDPGFLPGDTFNGAAAPLTRGIQFVETGTTTGFQISANSGGSEAPEFGRPEEFQTFSAERLFTPVNGTTFDVLFFNPVDQTEPAVSRGLGVVFVDVENASSTTMEFFDRNGTLLETIAVAPAGNEGLTFAGAIFDDPIVAAVSITSGTNIFDGSIFPDIVADGVVMDDFIFGEPTPVSQIPLPAPIMMLLAGLGALGVAAHRRT